MQNSRLLVVFFLMCLGAICSCSKYKDTKAVADPRLTNPYCNDPNAVNYNWGFPGKPDSTVCFYPTDVFKGVYIFNDSVFLQQLGIFVRADTFLLTIRKHSNTKFSIIGFCSSGDSLSLTAGLNFTATLDTTMGDSTTMMAGQALCSFGDTVNGILTKDILNDSLLYINLLVSSDTGVITTHVGTARLKSKN